MAFHTFSRQKPPWERNENSILLFPFLIIHVICLRWWRLQHEKCIDTFVFTISDTFLLPCCCNFQTPKKVIDGCHHCIVTESMSLANDQVIEGPTNPKKLWRHKKCHWHSKFNFYAFLKRRRSLIVSLLFCQTTFWGSRETPAPHVIL